METLFTLVPLIVFLPVLGLLINIIFGGRMGEKAIGAVASAASGLAFVVSVLLAYCPVATSGGEAHVVPFAEWIHIGTLDIPWNFRVDTLSVTMMLVVSGVGTLIHIYAIGYMHEDVRFKNDEGRYRRFFVFLNLFIAMMMILVSGDSYLMLFVGWEGVGLCSFLLIGFWYEMDTLGRPSWANSNAAKKAFITNRIGDFGFLLAGFTMFWSFGSLQFGEVFGTAAADRCQRQPGVILAITLFMLIGVAGKSAQIPLYVWLPDAMAGPTPVSALIHAATMVTAGVYLVARSCAAVHAGAAGPVHCGDDRRGDGALRRHDCRRAVRHQEGAGLLDHLASWASWWRRSAWAPSWPACSTWSRTPSSRRCCSSRPVRSSWAWSADITTWLTTSTEHEATTSRGSLRPRRHAQHGRPAQAACRSPSGCT